MKWLGGTVCGILTLNHGTPLFVRVVGKNIFTYSFRSSSSVTGFHHTLHSCLHALSNGEYGPFQSSLNQARYEMASFCGFGLCNSIAFRSIVMSDLAAASLESVLGIYPMMARLQCLVEMKEICRLMRKLVAAIDSGLK